MHPAYYQLYVMDSMELDIFFLVDDVSNCHTWLLQQMSQT